MVPPPADADTDVHAGLLARRYGLHRVLEPAGALPQAAWKLDARPERLDPSELLLDVERLNVDSASFRQLEQEAQGDPARLADRVRTIVTQRGKLHNPVTGSGGMLLGRVSEASGEEALLAFGVEPGERVATLVSLTLTPLHLASLGVVRGHQLEARGVAVVFASGAIAKMPGDLPERLALAALDVAGAAPQVERLVVQVARVRPRVLVLGAGGKSGLLCCAAAQGCGAAVVGVEASQAAVVRAERLGVCERVVHADARDPLAVLRSVGEGFDLVVSCVNVDDAEMAAVLPAREGGMVYFFSMATHFARAALGAEGVSRDVTMVIGNGYLRGHAERTLALVRSSPLLRLLLEELAGPTDP